MKYPEVSRRINEALNEAGLTQQQLSDMSGVPKASISHYCTGSHEPGNISAGKIATVLGVSPVWLMGFDVDKHQEELNARAAAYIDMLKKLPRDLQEKAFSYIDALNDINGGEK